MNDRFQRWREAVRSSLWFVPAMMGAAGAALAVLLLSSDFGLPDDRAEFWLLYAGDAGSARELLSALLSGMITMTSLVVSITMVVLTLAAGQIGPRLIRTFIQDRTTQAVLGLFLADIIYLLIVFRTIDGEGTDGVHHLAVTVGTGLTTFCLFVLLFFVHTLARSIIYDNVVRNVAAELHDTALRLLPEPQEACSRPPGLGDDFSWVTLGADGYVQTVDFQALIEAGREADAVIRLDIRPGHYVLSRGEHVAVHPARARTEDLCRRIRAAFVLGPERTPVQDIEFGISQLVEMATRALSPGINDVFTALAVIDNLASSLAFIFARGLEAPAGLDGNGTVRLVRTVPDYESMIGAAFDQIRQSGSGNPAILVRLADSIAALGPHLRDDDQRAALLEQLAMIEEAGERNIAVSRDLRILGGRCARARSRLESRGDGIPALARRGTGG